MATSETAQQNSEAGRRRSRPSDAPSRAYKACITCRKRKSRCDLGKEGVPPCLRCRRELHDCVFPEARAAKRQKTDDGPGSGDGARGLRDTCVDDVEDAASVEPIHEADDFDPHLTGSASPAEQPLTTEDKHDLVGNVVKTVISSGNDALDLLFEAATQDKRGDSSSGCLDNTRSPALQHRDMTSLSTTGLRGVSSSSAELREGERMRSITLWESCKFIRIGWLSTSEIVTLIEKFYMNMAHLTPALSIDSLRHKDHSSHLINESFLCSVVLMISSRYHPLKGDGGTSRSYFLHDRLWQQCQKTLVKLMLGQENDTGPPIRTLGTIEALLLLTEWHPRNIHFLDDAEGWDLDLFSRKPRVKSSSKGGRFRQRWSSDVSDPARRSDRMSWMLCSCALALAHELDVFRLESDSLEPSVLNHRVRIQRLLFIFINQLAQRQGSTSLMPSISIPDHLAAAFQADQHPIIKALAELTTLVKTFDGIIAPEKAAGKLGFDDGHRKTIIDHFRTLLINWHDKYVQTSVMPESAQRIMVIEYHFCQIYFNSIGIQSIDNGAIGTKSGTGPGLVSVRAFAAPQLLYTQEVISHACKLLSTAVQTGGDGFLRFAPVRVYLRITIASIFLLKAVATGTDRVSTEQAVKVLQQTATALKSDAPDDMHLANGYAKSMQVYTDHLEARIASLLPQSSPSQINLDVSPTTALGILASTAGGAAPSTESVEVLGPGVQATDFFTNDDWFSFPFDLQDLSPGQGSLLDGDVDPSNWITT